MVKKKTLDGHKSWKTESAVINSLVLDPQNVRLEIEEASITKIDQGSIANDLFLNENAMQILQSIVENGWFADETPIIVKEGGKSIVLEGNRRIAALKALQNPALIPTKSGKIQALADTVIPLKSVGVLVAPSREDALLLLANKHTQPTRRPWKPLRQGYFYYSQLSKTTTVKDLIQKYNNPDIPKFIRMCEVHRIASSYEFEDKSIEGKIRQQRTFPTSTIERLCDDAGFRQYLGFDFEKSGKIKISSSKKSFDEQMKTVLSDAAKKKIDTRKLNKEAARKAYYTKNLKKLRKSGKGTTSKSYKPKPPAPRPKAKTGLLSKSLNCTLNSPGIERVLSELQTINYGTFPNASHDLLRSFLEATLKEYLRKSGRPTQPRRQGGYIFLEDVLQTAKEHFKAESNHQMRQIVDNIIKMKESLDCINHNPSVFSTPDKVKEAADAMSDLIEFIFENYSA